MEVVLISGKQGSGKTTHQKMLIEKCIEQGITAKALNYADVIYEIHDFAIKTLESYGIKRDIKKDGKLLQLLGTEWGRHSIDPDIWVTCTKNKVEYYKKREVCDVVVIADCRFENEIDAFPDAITVRLTAPEELRRERCSQWREDTSHPSETSLDRYEQLKKFDFIFDTTLKSVTQNCDIILSEIIRKNFQQSVALKNL